MFAYTEVTLPDTSTISDEVTLSSQDQTVALSGKKKCYKPSKRALI